MKISILITSLVFLVACNDTRSQISSKNSTIENKAMQTSEFIQLAQNANCANLRNRLFVIDQKQVLWDKRGSCSDAAHAVTLFGDSPSKILCTRADSIMGPQTKCESENHNAMFSTILENLDKKDLGLGSAHQVKEIAVPAGQASKQAFTPIKTAFYRGATPENKIIKDSAAWKKFVADGKINLAATAVEEPDFATKMVVAVFYPIANDCSKTQILKLSTDGQALNVYYAEQKITAIVRCDNEVNSETKEASTPLSLVETSRIDLPSKFINISNQKMAQSDMREINKNTYSGVQQKKNLLIQDQKAWATLWKEHATQKEELPSIDFTKKMVLGIFLGERPSACYNIGDVHIWHTEKQINVSYMVLEPGPLVRCASSIVTPAILIEIPRSEAKIEFNPIAIKI